MAEGEMSGQLAEELAAITQSDQQKAARGQVAQMLYDHHKQLLAAGFTRVEALHLAANYQTALVVGQSAALERKRDS